MYMTLKRERVREINRKQNERKVDKWSHTTTPVAY